MIRVNLSKILGERRIKMSELAGATETSKTTILNLYHERVKGITWDVLDKICSVLECQPGDLLVHVKDEPITVDSLSLTGTILAPRAR